MRRSPAAPPFQIIPFEKPVSCREPTPPITLMPLCVPSPLSSIDRRSLPFSSTIRRGARSRNAPAPAPRPQVLPVLPHPCLSPLDARDDEFRPMPAPMARHPPLLDRRWQYAVGYWIMGFEQGYGFAGTRLMSCPAALHRRSPMLDLYFWPTGNGKKIIIQLEECELPYTIKPINIGRGDQLTPDFRKISPNGRMPAIVDHDPMGGGTPISIFESGAIMTYLAEKTGRFCPSDPRKKYDVTQWVSWQLA